MRILFMGRLSDLVPDAQINMALPQNITDSCALRNWLGDHFDLGDALQNKTVRTAINHSIVNDPHPVHDNDEIAFLPPVGGG